MKFVEIHFNWLSQNIIDFNLFCWYSFSLTRINISWYHISKCIKAWASTTLNICRCEGSEKKMITKASELKMREKRFLQSSELKSIKIRFFGLFFTWARMRTCYNLITIRPPSGHLQNLKCILLIEYK